MRKCEDNYKVLERASIDGIWAWGLPSQRQEYCNGNQTENEKVREGKIRKGGLDEEYADKGAIEVLFTNA